jgi:hypothetical protein
VAVIAAAQWSRFVDQLAADLPVSHAPPSRAAPEGAQYQLGSSSVSTFACSASVALARE